MKRLTLIFVFNFALLFSNSSFSQDKVLEDKGKEDLTAKRNEQIKKDILREIQAFSPKEQAKFYAQLGNIYWEHDRKEAAFWCSKGIELGISPNSEYKDDKEKLSSLWNLLHEVLKEDEVLANKLIVKLKEIKIDESNIELLKAANKTYILIAEQILHRKKDENLAFYFALLSLKGKNPAIEWNSSEFFWQLKAKNENLANTYFTKLVEASKNANDENAISQLVIYFVYHDMSNNPKKVSAFNLSDSQKKAVLELLLPFIQKESEELSLKKRDDCQSTRRWGKSFLEDYKKLLPEKMSIVEQALAVCQNSEIDARKKPDFINKPLKTTQDYLDFAKEIEDKKIQAQYLSLAAQKEQEEKNYRLSIDILDGIDKEFRNPFSNQTQYYSTSKLIEELFRKDDFPEVEKLLNSAPPEFLPFLIIDGVNTVWQLKPEKKDFVLNLMNRARTEFNKIDKFPSNFEFYNNPTKSTQITQLYVKFGLYEEAIASLDESIKSFNRMTANFPSEYKDKIIPRASSFSRFTNQYPPNDVDFIQQYFERIYENIGKIENSRIRLSERLVFLEMTLRKPVEPILIPMYRSSEK